MPLKKSSINFLPYKKKKNSINSIIFKSPTPKPHTKAPATQEGGAPHLPSDFPPVAWAAAGFGFGGMTAGISS